MDLEYKIKTYAELAGAEAAAEALERQIGKAKALKQDYSELNEQLKTMRQSIDEAKQSNEDFGKTHESESYWTKKLEIGKKELLESLRSLTREYPLLGEAARAVFNPISLSVFALISSYEILTGKVNNLAQAMGGVELPDLGGGLEEANQLATAYDGLEKSVKQVDQDFDSANSVYERRSKALNDSLTAAKELIAAEKALALSQLDIEKAGGKMSDAEYAAKKSRIETGASEATAKAEADARHEDLRARMDQALAAGAEAEEKAAKAKAFKLPEDDKAVDARVTEQKERAAALRKQAEEAKARAKEQEEIISGSEGGFRDRFGAAVGGLKNAFTYGGWSTPEEIKKFNEDNAKDLEAKAIAAEQAAQRLEQQKAERAKAREEAAAAAANAEKLKRGLEGEEDPTKPGSTAWADYQAGRKSSLDRKTEANNRFADDINRVTTDAGVQSDFARKDTWTPADSAKARNAQTDAANALADAAATIKFLADQGENVSKLAAELASVRRLAEQAKAAADQHQG